MLRYAALWVVTNGCGGPVVSIRASEGLAGATPPVRRVATAPLINRSDNPHAGVVMRLLLAQALSAQGIETVDVPPELAVDGEAVDRVQAGTLAAQLEVDAVLTGIVFAFGFAAERDPRPGIRVDLRLVEKDSGRLVWAAQCEATGEAHAGPRSVTRLADRVALDLAAAMAQRFR